MKIYTTTIIWVDVTESCQHETEVFATLYEARNYLLSKEQEWLENEAEYNCMTVQEWQEFNIIKDIDNGDCIYRNYIYVEGNEKVFELASHII